MWQKYATIQNFSNTYANFIRNYLSKMGPWFTAFDPPCLSTLPNDNFLDCNKFKVFVLFMISVFNQVENIVEKGENADYQHFPLLPQCFQKVYFVGSLELWIIW